MIRLPKSFKPTHLTAGLDGYPAIDVFGKPGENVTAEFYGTVRRLSGKNPAQGGKPGGAYGWSMYVLAPNGDDRYLTHFGSRKVKVGDKVIPGTVLGTVCDSAVSGKPHTSHIHYGLHKEDKPIPPPPERLYDVRGPRGRLWIKAGKMSTISKKLPALIKRWGPMRVSDAGHPE